MVYEVKNYYNRLKIHKLLETVFQLKYTLSLNDSVILWYLMKDFIFI